MTEGQGPITRRVVLASGNRGKLKEFQQRLGSLVSLVPQTDLGIDSPPETGLSFVENAILKARHAARTSGMAALADDSGLCVHALHGAPGIYSARYAGENATDAENNQRLLAELEGIAQEARTAHFVCVLVLMRHADDPQPIICEGNWHGRILELPRGNNGFGYDPLFRPQGLSSTSAELSPEEKNRISHRGQAMDQLVRALDQASYN